MNTMSQNNTATPEAGADQDVEVVTTMPRTAWEVIEEACHDHVTGELTLTTASPAKTKVYLTNGLVYFAERETDETLATRLVLAGALDLEQLHRGTLRLNGLEHLGRMFERDETIDRDAVELAIELITEQVLTDVAEQPVISYRTALFRQHSSGIARWFSAHHSLEEEVDAPTEAAEVVASPAVAVPEVDVAETVETITHADVVDITEEEAHLEAPFDQALEDTDIFDEQAFTPAQQQPDDLEAMAAALSILAPWDPDPSAEHHHAHNE